jgi:hypothetical protein
MPGDSTDRTRTVGARVAFWLVLEAKRMDKAGKTAQEIIERLNDLRHVLKDWRNDSPTYPLNLPSNEMPENWPRAALEKFIAMRKPDGSKIQIKGTTPQILFSITRRTYSYHSPQTIGRIHSSTPNPRLDSSAMAYKTGMQGRLRYNIPARQKPA